MFARMRKSARVAILTAGVTAICGAALIPATAQMNTFGKAFQGTNIPKKKAKPKVEAVPNPESPYYQGQHPVGAAQALQPVTQQPVLNPVVPASLPAQGPVPAPAPQAAAVPSTNAQQSGPGPQDLANWAQVAQAQAQAPVDATPQPGNAPSIQNQLEEMYRRDGREMPQMDYQSLGLEPPTPVYQENGAGQNAPRKPSFLQRWAPGLARHLPGWNRGGSGQQNSQQANNRPQQPSQQQTQSPGVAPNGVPYSPFGPQPANMRGQQYPAGHPLANQPRPQGQTGQGPVVGPGQVVAQPKPELRPVPNQNGGPVLASPGTMSPGNVAGNGRPRLPVVDVMGPATPAAPGLLPPVAPELAAAPQISPKKDDAFLLNEDVADQTVSDSVLLTEDPKKPAQGEAPSQTAGNEPAPKADTPAAADVATAEITPESLVAPVAPVSPYSGKKLDAETVAQASPDLLDGDEEDEDEEMLFDNPATQPKVAGSNEPPVLKSPGEVDVRPGGANSLPVAPPVDVDEQASSQEAQLARRSTMPGFKGFCPVTLRNQRKLVEARAEFSVEREGVVFQFASAEALAEFQIAPEKYVPAGSGNDVVLAGGGEAKAGTLDHAVWFRGKLYLFATAESRQTFVATPGKFAVP